jgi:serine phosphatase RsbU (regulator of sigma subunit)
VIDAGGVENRRPLPETELEKAAAVHYSFLPESFSNDFLDIAVYSRPFSKIGGDYYSIFPIDARRLILCMCDATGHDVASALFAARINPRSRYQTSVRFDR